MEQYLCIITSAHPEDWVDWLAAATAVHNNRRNTTTGLSPNQILFGHEVTLNPDDTPSSLNETTEDSVRRPLEIQQTAIQAINRIAKQPHQIADHSASSQAMNLTNSSAPLPLTSFIQTNIAMSKAFTSPYHLLTSPSGDKGFYRTTFPMALTGAGNQSFSLRPHKSLLVSTQACLPEYPPQLIIVYFSSIFNFQNKDGARVLAALSASLFWVPKPADLARTLRNSSGMPSR